MEAEAPSPRRRPRRLLRALAMAALVAVIGLGIAVTWLFYTASGFGWAIGKLGSAAGSSLVLEDTSGTLSGGITASRIRYTLDDGTTVEARDVTLRVSSVSLLTLAPRVDELHCALLAVTLAPSGKPATLPASLALPAQLHIVRARIERLTVKSADGAVEATAVQFGYSGDSAGHRLQNASFETYDTRVTGNVTVGAVKPFPTDAALTAIRKVAPAVKLTAHARGPLEALQVTAQASSPGGNAAVEGTLSPYGPLPVEKLRATLTGLDLRAFDAALPRTALEGSLNLEPDPGKRGTLKGKLELRNDQAGPYDKDRLPLASLQVALTTDLARVQATGRAELGPAGAFTGTGQRGPDGVTLSLRTDRLNLAGIHSRLRATGLSGRIDARIDGKKQSATADLAEKGVRLALHCERNGDSIELREVHARARGGEARGSGRVALAGAQPFSAEARFTAFDPAAWGDFPAGAVNGRAAAKGTLAPQPAFDADFALEPSQLRGTALSGSGRASVRGERIATAQAAFDWGGNRLAAQGAWGDPADVLAISIDAPRLGVAHPDLAGRLKGAAQLSGSWRTPGVKFEAAGTGLAFASRLRLEQLTARGEYSAQPDAPLRLAAAIAGLAVPDFRLQRGSLDVEGTRKAHVATLRAQGKDIDLSALARGDWQASGVWSGTIQELENRGQYAVSLEAPLPIEAGTRRLRMGKLAARIAGGRIDVSELRYEEGRVASQGQFNELRASVLLALAGFSPHAGGTMALSGAWSLTSSPRWSGTMSIRRGSGDLSLAPDNALPLGLETLTLDARIVDDRLDFRGALRARVATGRIDGTLLPVAGPAGPSLAAESPLKFTSSFEIARIAAFAPGAALAFDGRVRASIAGGGTLRGPLLTGTVEGDDLSIAYISEGVDLRNGTLRAELADREVRVQSFSIRGGEGVFRARGTLARGGTGRAAVDWEAERLTVMGRPGRRLIVTGRGNAALEDAKVSLSGELRADEGEIQLRSGALVAPGDDVVISGRQDSASDAPRLRQAALDLALDFGDRFRIIGRGLNTALAGKIRVQTGPAGNLVAKGSVRTVRGTYMAFGQRLDLERGRLIFDGPIDNPALDIRAMRKMPSVEAGVELAGTLRKPFVRVVSEPAMPENEALSWLILGHAPGDATGADLTMLPVAAAALLGQDDAGTGGVAQKFGLDSIGLRGGGGGTTGSQFVTFGKRVADNIYVVYEQSLGAMANVLKLEFNLTRRVLLRAETGETSGLGIFYRWAFD
jgi:translocation and assembly module TamB